MKIIVSAGGSGGHIYPALKIIEEFKRQEKNLSILYIGTHNRMEKDIIPKANIPYESLEVYGFTKDIKRDIKNISLIKKAYRKCLKIMQEFKPDVVIGVGGYVTYPVLKAARKCHIKTFIHEQNSRPGKVNYLTSKYADIVGVTFESSIPYFKKAKKVVYTGHPSLDSARMVNQIDKTTLGFAKNKKLVLCVAGSLGSASLNQKMQNFLNSNLHDNYEILYIVGNNVNLEEFTSSVSQSKNVKYVSYMDNLPGIMASSDLIISRAGAGVLFEILALGKPSIIIPSPNVANNHQYYNALELKNNGCISLIEEKDLTAQKLSAEIDKYLNSKAEVFELQKNMIKYQTSSPVKEIYKLIKDLIKSSN